MYANFKSFVAFVAIVLSLGANIVSGAPSVSNPNFKIDSETITSWGATCIEFLLPVQIAQSTPGNFSLENYDYKILYALANRHTLATNTYNLSTRVCVPAANAKSTAHTDEVQLLVHGATFNKIMWDFPFQPEKYSWTKKMNEAGYSTIAVDLVGAGNSSKPHGLLESQTATYVEAMHQVILQLKGGKLHPTKRWKKIIFVGFSIGGIVANSLAEKYPKDADIIVLLGISWDLSWIYPAFLAGLQTAANTIDPTNWGYLSSFYQTQPTLAAREVACFFGEYDRGALEADFKYRDFDTLGAAVTFTYHLVTAPSFSGPVFVGIGENDGTFCGEKCGSQPYAVYHKFPRASTHDVKVYAKTGHLILFHHTGVQLMDDVLAFLSNK